MSETSDSNDRDGREPPARPPYPGWSAEQPPQPGWTTPDGTSTSGPGVADQHGPRGQWTGGAGQSASRGQAEGWQSRPAQQWNPPAVKPGVIPLRPIGVGEIIEGAVATIRQNPKPMLGLSAVVAIIVQLLGLVALWFFLRDVTVPTDFDTTETLAEVLGETALMLGGAGLLVVLIVGWIGTVILTGMLTVVVSRAVLGERLPIGEAWARARPRIFRLLGLTIVYGLIVVSPVIVTALLIAASVAAGSEDAAVGFGIVGFFLGVPLMFWLYVRYALATPALMLESMPGAGGPRPIGIGTALRRSAELVRRSWWRVFGILLLVAIIASIVSVGVALLFSVPTALVVDVTDPQALISLDALSIDALQGVVTTAITAPFVAASIALLYVDRRIRRESLDIDLARAAGVTIPGRTDQPPHHPGQPPQPPHQ